MVVPKNLKVGFENGQLVAPTRAEMNLSPEELQAIGAVAVDSTYLEQLIENYIGLICGLTVHDLRVLLGNSQFGVKVQMLKEITRPRIPPEFEGWHEKLFGDIAHQVTERNDLVHGFWKKDGIHVKIRDGEISLILDDTEANVRRKHRGKAGSRLVPRKNIMETARALNRLGMELIAFLDKSGLVASEALRVRKPPPAA